MFAFLYEKANSKEICEEIYPFPLFQKNADFRIFVEIQGQLLRKNAWLPQFFFVNSNNPCKDLLFPCGPTCYLSSSCHVAHKASPQSRQPSLSVAAICTSLQFFHPAFSLSLSAVLLHVVLGLPRFRCPSGTQVNAVLQSFCSSFLMMWPMNFHLLLRTSSLRFSISANFRTSLFVILSYQHVVNIRLRHLLWKTSIFFYSHLFIFHVSQPYIKTGFTLLVFYKA